MTPIRRTAILYAGFAAMMLSLSFAAVPLYDWFCRVTGYGGTTSVASGDDVEPIDQVIRVRFDASKARGMEWNFNPPEERTVEIRMGETGLAFYRAHNPTDRPIAGAASYNVAPFSAGEYFVKIHCFCFEEQLLMPGETIEMPVTFYVDPEIVSHREAKFVNEITLSYTFHELDLTEEQLAMWASLNNPTPVN
ncbi:MAG: cytochrome c oxidase assembly protein [Pseudomonadota bacterium]